MKKPKSMDYMEYEQSMGMNRTPDKHEQLAKKVKQLESERREMIDALREAEQLSEAVIMSRKGCCGDHYVYTPQIYKNYADKLYNQIKTALRNAGREL